MDNIAIVKLVNGEMLIGSVEKDDQENVTISNSIQIGVVNDGIAFIDFNGQLTTDKALHIKGRQVLYTYSAGNAIKEAYLERISNIVVPRKGAGGPKLQSFLS